MIPVSLPADQSALTYALSIDKVVHRYRAFFSLFDWSLVERWEEQRSSRGRPAHPEAAYLKAFLVRINEGFIYTTQLRAYLAEHPLLVVELGFHLHLDPTDPLGFDVERTLPSRYWLCEKLRTLDRGLLQDLLAGTVHALQQEIPGLGEVVSFDVKHIYAWVQENNERAYGHPIATTRPNAWRVILTAGSASSAAPTRNFPMALSKRRKNSSGAMVLALPLPPHPITAMSCWLNTPNPSMKAM